MSTPARDDRSTWPVRAYRLGSEPGDDLSRTTTPEQRLAMMWPLAVEAWELSGQPQPDYTREQTPILFRPVPARRDR